MEQTDTAHVLTGGTNGLAIETTGKRELARTGFTLDRQCTSLHSNQHIVWHMAGALTGICVWSVCGMCRKNTLPGSLSTESAMLRLLECEESVTLIGSEP